MPPHDLERRQAHVGTGNAGGEQDAQRAGQKGDDQVQMATNEAHGSLLDTVLHGREIAASEGRQAHVGTGHAGGEQHGERPGEQSGKQVQAVADERHGGPPEL